MARSRAVDAAVVILNRDGRRHLAHSVPAALALQGLAGPWAVLVADDGSRDDSTAFVRASFPEVRLVAWRDAVGFAAGNNRAIEEVGARYALLLNNDTVARCDALTAMVAEAEAGAEMVAARLVSWDGQRLDFDGGGASFTGHGHPLGHGRPVPRGRAPARETLFASGAGTLVRTEAFRRLGGFEETYFAYYEDVDLGWRTWLAGGSVRHVPRAVVRHRGGGSAGLLGGAKIGRLHERNALATVVRNYGDEALRRLLPASLALAACRAGCGNEAILAAEPAVRAWPPLPDRTWPGWTWIEHLGLDWPGLLAARERVQALRARPDEVVLAGLGMPLAPVPATPRMARALAEAHRRFGLAEWFGPLPGWASPAGLATRAALGGVARMVRGGT